MHRVLVSGVLIFCACGGPREPVTQNVVLAPVDAAVQTQAREPPAKVGVPKDAAFVLSFDLDAIMRIDDARKELEHMLGLGDGALKAHPELIGIDMSRPGAIAVAGVSDMQRKLIDEIRPLTASRTPTPRTAEGVAYVLAHHEEIPVRILLPATDAEKLEQAIGVALKGDGWKQGAKGFTKHSESIALSDDGANVAIDIGDKHIASMTHASEAPPALDGRIAHATWSPSALASMGFAYGVARTCLALSGESIDPAQRDTIAAQGFYEAGRVFPLATFDRVDVDFRLGPFELVVRAKPQAGFAMPGPSAFAASPSISLDGTTVAVEGTQTLAHAWPFPGGDSKTTFEMLRDAGGPGWFVAFPHFIAGMPFFIQGIGLLSAFGAVPMDMTRFERIESLWAAGYTQTFVGILPVGSSRAAAECVLQPRTPCDPKTRLKVGSIVRQPSPMPNAPPSFAKLVELDHRFVVLTSSEEAPLKAKATTRMTGPVHVEADTSFVGGLLPANPLPARVAGDVTVEDGSLVFRMK